MMLSRIAELTQGHLRGADAWVERVSIDTRTLQPGDLFVALRGEQFDGHAFVEQAMAAGACAALVERALPHVACQIQVDDSRRALGLMAAGWADQFSVLRLAVTGNAGKTTVKEMIAAMLGNAVHATHGNLNNEIGVPLTLLALNESHRHGVFELGASHEGEIAWTSALVRPQIGLITNVTGAHLGGFGSMDGIARAKAELYSGMPPGSWVILNQDDAFAEFFADQARRAGLHTLAVSASGPADLWADSIITDAQGVRFQLHGTEGALAVQVPLPGRHQVMNALMSLAAVERAGVPLEVAVARLATLQPVPGRMIVQACRGGTLVDDSYNANPGSVRAAMQWLAEQPAPRLLVLGGIGELGDASAALHRQLGEESRALGLDLLAVGELAAPAAQGHGAAARLAEPADAEDAALNILEQGGTVLVKGSRAARMERLVNRLQRKGESA